MTKYSSRPRHHIYSVLASGLGCASLLGGVTNIAIAKQVIALASTPTPSGAHALMSVQPASVSSPMETAVVLPPEHFPLEIPATDAQIAAAAQRKLDAVSLNRLDAEEQVAAATGKSVNLISVDIDTSAADAPSVTSPAMERPASTQSSESAGATAADVPPAANGPLANPPAATLPDLSTDGDAVDYGTQYIDPTDYSVGATEPIAGPDVVLTERSTGCKAVLRQGEAVPASLCDAAAANDSATESATPGANTAATLPADVNAVRVGAVTIDGRGIHLRRSVRDYYSRTARPKALRSNGNRALMFPLSIPARISSPFGWRIHPIFGNRRLHTGTDLAAPQGTPVVAAFSGRVALSDILGGYGVTVVLQHDDRSAQTLYGHLSEVFVKSGEWVEQGTVIGRVGNTGNSTGPHLHFEYRQRTADGWIAVNAGELLQQALGYISDGFQLAEVQLGRGLEISELSIPKLLRTGKDATKSVDLSTLAANIAEPESFDR